jgi:hypothetical protein
MEYQLLIDQWEGSLDINEDILLDAGIVGVVTRINSMSGGHHKDNGFDSAWPQTKPFPMRAPYFVYNPWVSGVKNFEYLASVMPKDAHGVMQDIEVKYEGYSPTQYSQETGVFLERSGKNWRQFGYTGQWFYDHMSYWHDIDYCLARYPYLLYPSGTQNWTWDQLKQLVSTMEWNPGTPPKLQSGKLLDASKIKLWQCSGDRLIFPGTSGKCMDIILWNGDLTSLMEWWGETDNEQEPEPTPTPDDIDLQIAELKKVTISNASRIKALEDFQKKLREAIA